MDKKILMVGCDYATMQTTTAIIEKVLGERHEVIIVNNHEVKNQLREQILNKPEPTVIKAPPVMREYIYSFDKKGKPLPKPKSKYHK
jgi:hypothetical protein